ncbi:MAG: hypothetical protein LC796_08000 [Acidobacteria bacterium]|nr:hypothetical protein [Acidobacteriota bacterium]MCA1612391.1 hypothetical protein [Acidobacteriota bacterium]
MTMTLTHFSRARLAALFFLPAALLAQTSAPAPPAGHDHHAMVDSRGDHVMGFDHDRTTHHFRLYKTGGAVEITANQAEDTASRDAIRGHLSHIAKMFSKGNFQAPMLIHDQVPPGVEVMKKRPSAVAWKFRETDRGATLEARAADREGLEALHHFLRFQIEDHRTGDPTGVTEEKR